MTVVKVIGYLLVMQSNNVLSSQKIRIICLVSEQEIVFLLLWECLKVWCYRNKPTELQYIANCLMFVFYLIQEVQVVGKGIIAPDLRQFSKCGLILGMSKLTDTGFCPYARLVAKAIANMPQSLPLSCC